VSKAKRDKRDAWERAFDKCATFLQRTAAKIDPHMPGGMDYVKINVIGFCIILPVVLIISLGCNALWLLSLLGIL
jgi:hypothetical protein